MKAALVEFHSGLVFHMARRAAGRHEISGLELLQLTVPDVGDPSFVVTLAVSWRVPPKMTCGLAGEMVMLRSPAGPDWDSPPHARQAPMTNDN